MLDDDRAEQHRAENGDGMLRAIRHDEGNPIAAAHARLVEGSRAPAHVIGELRVRELACKKIDGGTLGVSRGDLHDHLGNGLSGRCDLVGDAGCVQGVQLRREVHLSSCGNGIPTIP